MAEQLIVVGASAGGVEALLTIAKGLPADFAAPVIVVLHIGMHRSLLPELMSARGPNKAVHAQDRIVPKAGTIYVAPPDHHVLIEGGLMHLSRGPVYSDFRSSLGAVR